MDMAEVKPPRGRHLRWRPVVDGGMKIAFVGIAGRERLSATA